MSELVLYHNPRCSKSRAALGLLEEHGADVRIVEYLRSPPTRDELEALCRKLGRPPREWIRKGETAFSEAELSLDAPAEVLLDAMAASPILIERPIGVRGERAVVGRPPESILELL